MLLFIVILLYGLTFITDFLPVTQNKGAKIKAVYLGCACISFIILILYAVGVAIPSPTLWMLNLIDS